MDTLPEELVHGIIRILLPHDILTLSETSKCLYKQCNDQVFWENELLKEGVATKEQYRTMTGTPIIRYLKLNYNYQLHHNLRKLFQGVYDIGMYINGWNGTGFAYPESLQYNPNWEFNTNLALIDLHSTYDSLPEGVQLRVKNIKAKGPETAQLSLGTWYLFDIITLIRSGRMCCRMMAPLLISSVLYHREKFPLVIIGYC